MKRDRTPVLAALMLGFVTLVACSDSTGPDLGTGAVSVLITGDAGAANRIGPGISLSMGDVPESAVSNLFLDITRVELHRVGADDEGEEGAGEEGEGESEGEGSQSWITLEVTLEAPIDVLTLSETGVQLAAGTLPAGRYNQARFFFDTSQLVLSQDITAQGGTVVAGTYDVRIPSAEQTGLKLQLSDFNVVADETGTLGIELGAGATIGSLVHTGNGFQLSPVLRRN